MFDYLQQFNNLPKNLRDQVSSSESMHVLTELENKYKLDLAMVVMKVMIRNIAVNNLVSYFISEGGLNREAAEELTRELKEKIFIGVADYLGIMSDIRALDLEKDIKIIIREAGLTLASLELVNRFKSILATYLRGIRAKIDTRAVLAKEVISGGLNLSALEIDRVFKVCETQKFKSLNITISTSPINSTLSNRILTLPGNRLDKLINSSEGKLAAAGKIADYNLKDVIARGQIQKQVNPVLLGSEKKLNLPAGEQQLDLPAGEKTLNLSAPIKLNTPPKPAAEKIEKIETEKTSLNKTENKLETSSEVISSIIKSAAKITPLASIVKTATTLNPVSASSLVLAAAPEILKAAFPPKAVTEESKNISPSAVAKSLPIKPASPVTESKSLLKSAPVIEPTIKSVANLAQPNNNRANLSPTPKINFSGAVNQELKSIPVVSPNPVQARQNLDVNLKRPAMHDIKPMPKVMGPIEELQFLDVINFRRLGSTPSESVIKIFNKIKQLEKEGYDKMISGIKAWRQSPVNHLYLKIGQEAISKGITVKDAALVFQKTKPEYLNIAEIEAIVSLNSKLVF